MPRPKRQFLATAEDTLTPPSTLEPDHMVVRVVKGEGKNLYTVSAPDGESILVEMPAKFRSSIWIKRGSFVVIDIGAFEERENKIGGEVVNVVGDAKAWRKMPFWPKEFPKTALPEDSDDDESTAGKMPPSDSESDSD